MLQVHYQSVTQHHLFFSGHTHFTHIQRADGPIVSGNFIASSQLSPCSSPSLCALAVLFSHTPQVRKRCPGPTGMIYMKSN